MKSRNEALKSQTDPETGLAITDRWIIRGDKLAFVDKDNKLKSVQQQNALTSNINLP